MAREVDGVVRRIEQQRSEDEDLSRLRDFLTTMRDLGFAPKKPYDLPPLDTIGRTAFRNSSR